MVLKLDDSVNVLMRSLSKTGSGLLNEKTFYEEYKYE